MSLEPGVSTMRLGGQTRKLKFDGPRVLQLEKRLDGDVMAHLAGGKGTLTLICEIIYCGLVKRAKDLTTRDIATWIYGDPELDEEEVAKELVYMVARAKPAKQSVRMVRMLDALYQLVGDDDGSDEAETEGPLADD